MSFDYGADPVSSGGNLKQAAVGAHEARLLGIVHLGLFEDEFKGKKKAAAPFVTALFELKSGEEGGGVNEDGSPIIMQKSFPLKKGDKAFLTKFMQVLLTADEFKKYQAGVLSGGFGDLIGRAVQIQAVGSDALDDDGNPKYVNIGSLSALPAKFANMVDPLAGEPIGHVTLAQYTPEVLKALPPFEIYDKLEKSVNFPGSKADEVLRAVRKENPEFAKRKPKDGQASSDESKAQAAPPPPADLDEAEDFS